MGSKKSNSKGMSAPRGWAEVEGGVESQSEPAKDWTHFKTFIAACEAYDSDDGTGEDIFAWANAWYHYLVLHHEGQMSKGYRALCQLQEYYKPSFSEQYTITDDDLYYTLEESADLD